ncbi:MAG: hypothetical protein WD431_24760 [Cyclobacteriaceae bacterium]
MRTKEKLIEKILHIDDESILEDILGIVDMELNLAGDPIKLTDEQRNFIDEGLKDIEKGNFIPNEEAKRRSEKWLKNRLGGHQ